jgi:effector-binding domain-containing protein
MNFNNDNSNFGDDGLDLFASGGQTDAIQTEPEEMEQHEQTGTTEQTTTSGTSEVSGTSQLDQTILNEPTGGQFMIKTLTGKNIVVDYNPDMTVMELKQFINTTSNIPIDQQRLIYQGKQMDNDDYKIKDYNVMKDSSVHLVLKLRGGVVYYLE